MTGLSVIDVGLHATIQDLGRVGYLGYGITAGGSVDAFALRCANRLVGNTDNHAGIEVVLGGITLMASCNLQLALSGAPVTLHIDGEQYLMNTRVSVAAGSTVTVGRAIKGAYSYLAFKGGVSTPLVLGSRSTVIREGLGGLNGKALAVGDLLPVTPCAQLPTTPTQQRHELCQLPNKISAQADILRLRFLPGLHYDDVTQDCRENLCAQNFRVSGSANRMAIPLNGSPVNTGMTKLWSEATCLGSIQIPPDGQPLVLMNDRQTMGGYPQVGVIIPPDRVRLSQARAGQRVRLEALSTAQAEQIVWLHEHYEETHLKALDSLGCFAP
jgi:biotin-dependent carboxylase-like uncharacterized protein